jgi:WD40 repeat protein
MKQLGKNRLVDWRLIVSALLIGLAATALSQGRPGILWASAGHSDSVISIAYSPDGQLLVSGSNDQTNRAISNFN